MGKSNFMDKIDSNIKETNLKKQKIHKEILEYTSKIEERKNKVEKLKQKYREDVDPNILENIEELNNEINNYKNRIEVIKSIPDCETKIIPDSDIKKELDIKMREFRVKEIKESLIDTHDSYLSKLKEYNDLLNKIYELRHEYVKRQKHIELETLKEIDKYFNGLSSEIHIELQPIANDEEKYKLWINSIAVKISGYNDPFEY